MALNVAGCSSNDKPQKPEPTKNEITPDINRLPSTLRDVFSPNYRSGDRESCPFFTRNEAKSLFKEGTELRHSAPTYDKLYCTVKAPSTTGNGSDAAAVNIFVLQQKGFMLDPFGAVKEIFSKAKPSSNDPLADLAGKVPGYGFQADKLDYYWTCGPFAMSYETVDDSNLFNTEDNKSVELTKVIRARINEMCGTVEDFPTEMMGYKKLQWEVFDSFGGTSPHVYGNKRPKDMTPLPRIKPGSALP